MKINAGPDDSEEYAAEVSNVSYLRLLSVKTLSPSCIPHILFSCISFLQILPFADHDLYNNLVAEAKSLNPLGNAVFDVHCTYSLSDSMLVCVVTGVLIRLICLPVSSFLLLLLFHHA